MKFLILSNYEKILLNDIIEKEINYYKNWLKRNIKFWGYSNYMNIECQLNVVETLINKLNK
jgi:hypothetical protein